MDIDTIWAITFGVMLVILGFNALILVHEFGHFAVARLCKVRCDKFYLFFDFWGLRLCRFKWGDTEYGVGLFPLGGYVKMLGQEDDPSAIRAEIEKAKLQTETPTDITDSDMDAPQAERPTNSEIFSPDSYLSKSVPQRFAIIVAGVAMNFLFAIVCGAGAYMIGVKETVPAVGNVVPGSPAWEAGLQTGDRITAIDGKDAKAFGDVLKKMIEGKKTVQLDIDRHGEALTLDVTPRRRSGDLTPNIGILSLATLELQTGNRLHRGLVRPSWAKYYSDESLKTLESFDVLESLTQRRELQPVRLEKVNGQPIETYAEYLDAQLQHIGQPITYTINGKDIEIPAIPKREIPVRFAMGEITSVLPGSDAARQGIMPGDTIVSVDGDAEIDPFKLPQILLRKVNAGQTTVELAVKNADGERTLTVAMKPIRIMPELSAMSMRDPMGSTALGLSWNVEPIIADFDAYKLSAGQTMPAVGDRVVGVEFVNSERILRKNSFTQATEDGFLFHEIGNRVDIPYIFSYLLQDAQLADKKTSWLASIFGEEQPDDGEERILFVRLMLETPDGEAKTVDMPILESTDWFNTERGYFLKAEQTTFTASGLGDAISRGTIRTLDYGLLVYRSVQALLDGSVSPRALNGPVGIIEIMYRIAQSGWSEYLMLLCLVGVNLAVINLLPIPPLDGGHLVFLTYEGIFRRPPNEMLQVVLSYFGLLLIIVLMVWTVSLDLTCIPRW
ncbi:MAG: site-2 protease family protein [Planctomycetaceae bacterium]|nr:site-2 protease family protein [Planctomycetaceae bacterium]